MSTADLMHSVPLYRDGVQGVCECMKRDCVSERMRCRRGRSPAHTKTAHSNTSAGLLLKINSVWKRVRQKEQETLLSLPAVAVLTHVRLLLSTPTLQAISTRTSAWRFAGGGVLHYALLHYVDISSPREQMTKAGRQAGRHGLLTYHEIQLIMLVANGLTSASFLSKKIHLKNWSVMSLSRNLDPVTQNNPQTLLWDVLRRDYFLTSWNYFLTRAGK